MSEACSSENKEVKQIAPFSDVAKFHGHVCPGLTIGYMAAKTGIEELCVDRDVDEELVTIVENDACGVDAVQVITGCTIGKGNLIFKDYGKQAFTFICRDSGKAVRVVLKASFNIDALDPELGELRPKVMSGTATESEIPEFRKRMNCVSELMRETPAEKMFEIKHVSVEIPQKARIFNSVKCTKCEEMVAESRARVQNGELVCISCYDEYTRGW
ncbi:formylmethanofuran dehydrogenase [Methanosarcina sp. Ant1]|nr:formylmethanofuran dehydrogenase [Methanosarcina sp. Ant1]